MTWLKQLLDTFDHEQLSTIFSSILYRMPIIVLGNDNYLCNATVDNIVHLVPHRQKSVFWSDFISKEEAELLLEDERIDPKNNRVVLVGYSSNAIQAINRFDDFKGWVLSFVPKSDRDLNIVFENLSKNGNAFLVIYLNESGNRLKIYSEKEHSNSKITQDILNKVIVSTKNSITKIARIVAKKNTKDSPIPLLEGFLEFTEETEYIQQDVFEKEIMEFVHATRRALILFTRIKLMKELKIDIKLDLQTLMSAIDFDKIYVNDVLAFLQAEYDYDYSYCLNNSRISRIGDQVDSLWGIKA